MVALLRPVKFGPPSKPRSDVLSDPLDTVHGSVHPRLGQPLTLYSNLVLLGASKESVEMTRLLVHAPSVQLVGTGLPLLLRGVVAHLLREAVYPGGLF